MIFSIAKNVGMMEENVIEVKQLSKRFQTTVALQGCDFAVRKGEALRHSGSERLWQEHVTGRFVGYGPWEFARHRALRRNRSSGS